MSDGLDRPVHVSWGWVLLGVPAGLLATFDEHGAGAWWLIAHTAAFVWGLPHVPATVAVLAVLAVLAVAGWAIWRWQP